MPVQRVQSGTLPCCNEFEQTWWVLCTCRVTSQEPIHIHYREVAPQKSKEVESYKTCIIGKFGLCIQKQNWLSKHLPVTGYLSLTLSMKLISSKMKHAFFTQNMLSFFLKKADTPCAAALAKGNYSNSLSAYCFLLVLSSSAADA